MSEYTPVPIPKTEQEFINYRLDQDDQQIDKVSAEINDLAKAVDSEFVTKEYIRDSFALINTKLNFQNKLIYGIISAIGITVASVLGAIYTGKL